MDTALWLFIIAVSIHMLEEVIWLPSWSLNAGRWHMPVSRRAFLVATLLFLAILLLATLSAIQTGQDSASAYLVVGFALVMILNLLVPHLGATLDQRRYAPGLLTALLCTVPTSVYLLFRSTQRADFAVWRLAGTSVVVLLASIVVWPLLLRFGLWATRSRFKE